LIGETLAHLGSTAVPTNSSNISSTDIGTLLASSTPDQISLWIVLNANLIGVISAFDLM
jgi:hypothetical protein